MGLYVREFLYPLQWIFLYPSLQFLKTRGGTGDEVPVKESFLDYYVHHAEGKGRITAGPWLEEQIRHLCPFYLKRVHHGIEGALFPGLSEGG